MAITLSDEEVLLRELVGTQMFLQGRDLLERGDVLGVQWDHKSGRAFGQVGSSSRTAKSSMVSLVDGPAGALTIEAHCTCRSGQPCPHAVAVLLAVLTGAASGLADAFESGPAAEPVSLAGHGSGQVRGQASGGLVTPPRSRPARAVPARPPAWERALAGLITAPGPGEPGAEAPQVGLQFEIITDPPTTPNRYYGEPDGPGELPARIGLRPVVPGRKNNWVRSGISWSRLAYQGYYGQPETDPGHLRLMAEVAALAAAADDDYYAYQEKNLYLETIPSRRIWDVLAEARELGMPLIQAGRRDEPVLLHAEPVRITLEVARTRSGLALEPRIALDPGPGTPGEQVLPGASVLIGSPAHGLAWWQAVGEAEPQPKHRVLRLARLAAPLDPQLAALLAQDRIQIPAKDESRFLRDYFPALRRRITVAQADDSVKLPPARPPVLALDVHHLDGHRAELHWEWNYVLGETRRREPLGPQPGADRDLRAEAGTVREVLAVAAAVPEMLDRSPLGPRLAPEVTLSGMALIRLLDQVLPALSQLPDVEVRIDLAGVGGAPVPDYREAENAPVVTISGTQAEGERDWFDLAFSVSVDGQVVPFNDLFVALAHGHPHLILSSGTYFTLDRPEFRQLADLIAEARALEDHHRSAAPGAVRLSRFQAGLWNELEQIGVVDGQAAAWQDSVRALGQVGELAVLPAPGGLDAQLRPYQLEGFAWLAQLYRLGLGGVLADDMGLGKTLQALALILHTREQGLSADPFLVIAPTSVVFNWSAEVARFAPGLKVAAISETRARRGIDLATAIAGADIVVTSYTLFRLEYDEYAAVGWAGLVLDEAQFVKNHQSLSYQVVKQLPAPFKLAITGTPMENNLMELWSLLSITAPGLFASPTRFTEHYRTPIEKNKDAERLDRLRRRIRPLMLRRTKDQVAADLPDKQEQVIELELNPKHRKIYQTHLQRERQKVLGLLGDLDKNRFEIFRSLTLLRQASLDVALIDPKYAGTPSTKLDAMMEQVADIVEEGHRTLVFSQFTRFLDAARQRLEAAGVDYCYLDGSTRNRGAVLTEFKQGTAPVFLISLKAGGFGLNLTEADYCILLDPWWNPATEAQAVDRVHRIGQTRKVMVYRLVAKDTIEEKVMALKATKAALFAGVMDGGAFESAALSAADIRTLLE